MKNKLTIGVNTAMFDGWDLETTFSTIKNAGFRYVELAYNQGYVGNLNSSLFEKEHAHNVAELLDKYQLKMYALGCTIPLSGGDALEQFSARIRFAGMLGVKYLNIAPGKKEFHHIIIENLKALGQLAAENHCFICLENGGDPGYDFITCANEAFNALEAIGSDSISLNVDPGNTVSMRRDIDAIGDALVMLSGAKHCHIKDVTIINEQYYFPAIGQGGLDYRHVLKVLEEKQIPCSLEIPLRMHRKADTTPVRSDEKVSLELITRVLLDSKKYIEGVLGYQV